MEKLKEPPMILSVINTTGMIAMAGYFYKQIETLTNEMNNLKVKNERLAAKVKELEKAQTLKDEKINKVETEMGGLEYTITENSNILDNFDFDLEQIVSVLEEKDIVVKRPSKKRVSSRSWNRKNSSTRGSPEMKRNKRKKRREPESDSDDDSGSDVDIINSVRKSQSRN